jgi:hypothetical protein
MIEQLMDFYEKILILSPAYKRGSYPKSELLKQSIISSFANLPSLDLKDSQPFFDLLEWYSPIHSLPLACKTREKCPKLIG